MFVIHRSGGGGRSSILSVGRNRSKASAAAADDTASTGTLDDSVSEEDKD